jgi:hypothetical protein
MLTALGVAPWLRELMPVAWPPGSFLLSLPTVGARKTFNERCGGSRSSETRKATYGGWHGTLGLLETGAAARMS